MLNKKDKSDIEKAKKLIEEQVEATKKLDLGLDADASSIAKPSIKSKFDGFINDDEDLPPLNYK